MPPVWNVKFFILTHVQGIKYDIHSIVKLNITDMYKTESAVAKFSIVIMLNLK